MSSPDSNEEPYLLRLNARLSRGLSGCAPEYRERHRRFVLTQQMPDGGFRGREGDSDLYYTGFAVRTLAILGEFRLEDANRVAGYLRAFTHSQLSVIDLVSWLYCALMVQVAGGPDVLSDFHPEWPARLAELLESFRTDDGGYAKTHDGAAGSTYHSFLVLLCYELIGRRVPRPNRLIQFVFDRQRDDGGFVEIAPMKRSGTNPTAAGVAILTILGGLDAELREDIRAFLVQVRSLDGGFQANTRIPFADGLSTFTGLLTCLDLGFPDLFETDEVLRFVNTLEMPDGGCKGASWDQTADVEYTFYALGVRSLVSQ